MGSVNLGDLIRNAQPGSFEPLPIGEYDVAVDSAEYKPTKNGDPMFVVVFKVQGGPHDGRKLYRNFAITERSVGIVVDQMGILGVSQEALANAVSSGEAAGVCSTLVDARARVKVKHREWQSKIQNDVERIMPAISTTPAALGADTTPVTSSKPARPF